jgi:hypothetical protein
MSLYGNILKPEQDFSSIVDVKVPECEKIAKVMTQLKWT